MDLACNRLRDFLRRVLAEVMVLAGHRSEPGHLPEQPLQRVVASANVGRQELAGLLGQIREDRAGLEQRDRFATADRVAVHDRRDRSEEHTSELQSLMRISYAVFCLKKKK